MVVEVLDSRIWVDGCFDFAHHGHAGAMLQARQQGTELYAGVHSDEEILINKGPVVMKMDERRVAVEGCRWCTKCIVDAPYVTDPKFLDSYGCKYVVHGDDITTDANGYDCYQTMKDLGRFIVVKRTPNISTTDLVGRMLLYSKGHHISDATKQDWIKYKSGSKIDDSSSNQLLSPESVSKFKAYASGPNAKSPGVGVYIFIDGEIHELVKSSYSIEEQEIYYIDGAFDLFNPGHIIALKTVSDKAHVNGCKLIVGINSDTQVNLNKKLNYPVMNIFERSLCVLQSKYIDGIIINAPYDVTSQYIDIIPGKKVVKVFHGPTPEVNDPYKEIKEGRPELFENIGPHEYDDISTETIVKRVLNNRAEYEERQRKKGWKAEHEKVLEAEEKGK